MLRYIWLALKSPLTALDPEENLGRHLVVEPHTPSTYTPTLGVSPLGYSLPFLAKSD